MSCLLTSGISLSCANVVSGVRELYITNQSNVTGYTNSVDGTITVLPMSAGTKFYDFYFQHNAVGADEKLMSNIPNGTRYYEQTITAEFTKKDAAKRNVMKVLAQARLVAVVKDQNGKFWYYGEINGLDAKDGAGSTGKNKGDFNGYSITLSGEEPNYAQEIDSTYAATAFGASGSLVSPTVTAQS